MQANRLKKELIDKLSAIMPKNEALSELDFILQEKYKLTKRDLILYPELLLKHKNELEELINLRVSTRTPMQYIIKKAFFYNDVYYVDKNVLIPRPETELLVNELLKYANSHTKILDIGTGSGCIAVSLAKYLKNDLITASDISETALNIAKLNFNNICIKRKMTFLQSDIFSNVTEKYDIIVSNPPYIAKELKKDMQPEVLQHEPHSALFAEDDGLFFYNKIIHESGNYLKKNGMLALELGYNQAAKIKRTLEDYGFTKVIIIPDLNCIDRIVLAWYNYSVNK